MRKWSVLLVLLQAHLNRAVQFVVNVGIINTTSHQVPIKMDERSEQGVIKYRNGIESGNGMKLKACMDNTPYADPLDVKISPNPISLEQGSKLYVDYKIHLKKAIEVGSKVKATIKKKILFWIKIPCIPIPGTELKFGSCEWDIDELLGLAQKHSPDICSPQNMPKGQSCEAPIKPGDYKSHIPNTIGDIPSVLKLPLKGNLWAKIEVLDQNENPIICLEGFGGFARYQVPVSDITY